MITHFLSLRIFSLRSIHVSSYVALLAALLVIPFCVTAHGGDLEPYDPANGQFPNTIQEVWKSQAFRPPAVLERRVREALWSINKTEGQTGLPLAELLSSRLKATWAELERSRAVGGLGYTEFDAETFQAAEAAFQEVLTQFVGIRTPSSGEKYQAILRALDDVQALSRNARRAVPGLSSDDVLLMREKRQKFLMKEPREEESSGRR